MRNVQELLSATPNTGRPPAALDAGSSPRPRRARLISRAEIAARRSADSLLATAERQARDLVREAKERAEAVTLAARQAGEAEAATRLAGLLGRLAAATDAIIERQAEDIVHIGVGLARSIIATRFDEQPNAIEELARAALHKVRSERRVLVRVHPSNHALLEEAVRLGSLGAPNRCPVAIVCDATVDSQACVVETEQGTYHADPQRILKSKEAHILLAVRARGLREVNDV